MHMHRLVSLAFTLPVAAVSAQVQQSAINPPPLSEAAIINKLRDVRLDASRTSKAALAGSAVTFTPVTEAQLPATQAAIEGGAVLGQIVIQGGAVPPLGPGSYHVFVSKTSQGLRASFERDGKIVASTSASLYPPPGLRAPSSLEKPAVTVGDRANLMDATREAVGGPSDDAGPARVPLGRLVITIPTKSGKIVIDLTW